jgi:glycosyltransferase involved in cell wall biosynthesis
VAWALAGRPAQEGLYAGAAARDALGRALDEPWDLVVVQLVRSAWALDVLARRAPGLPVLYDAIDSMALHFRRAASLARPPWSWALRSEASRCARRERELVDRAAVVTAVARRDLEALGELRQKARLVPVGVAAPEEPAPLGEPPTVLLSGNLGYRPTVAAAERFAAEVWPRLRARVPAARWLLAGARPARSVRALGSLPGVEVHGDVADLGPFLARATVSIAPMATGSGVPIKVLEAWAAERPVVAHPWAAAGLEEDPAPGVAVAERAEEWVETLARLLTDHAAAAGLAERGRAVWARHYRPEAVRAAILDAVTAAIASR